jgi:hypothetical protein
VFARQRCLAGEKGAGEEVARERVAVARKGVELGRFARNDTMTSVIFYYVLFAVIFYYVKTLHIIVCAIKFKF